MKALITRKEDTMKRTKKSKLINIMLNLTVVPEIALKNTDKMWIPGYSMSVKSRMFVRKLRAYPKCVNESPSPM
jgi:hypothetical protein